MQVQSRGVSIRHSAFNLDFLKSDVEIKIEMQIFNLASRADMDLWTNPHRDADKLILFSHFRNVGSMSS